MLVDIAKYIATIVIIGGLVTERLTPKNGPLWDCLNIGFATYSLLYYSTK
jgi:hypothetical protein